MVEIKLLNTTRSILQVFLYPCRWCISTPRSARQAPVNEDAVEAALQQSVGSARSV